MDKTFQQFLLETVPVSAGFFKGTVAEEYDTRYDHTYESGDYRIPGSFDDVEQLGTAIIDAANAKDIDLKQFPEVRMSMKALGETELSPATIGSLVLGYELADYTTTDGVDVKSIGAAHFRGFSENAELARVIGLEIERDNTKPETSTDPVIFNMYVNDTLPSQQPEGERIKLGPEKTAILSMK